MASGIVWFHITARKIPEDMSAAPAAASAIRARTSASAKPKAMIATPYAPALSATARPWRVTRPTQPLESVSRTPPTGPAA